nr:MAG TPA: hypothetical protein [Caudoviricetes sp.]
MRGKRIQLYYLAAKSLGIDALDLCRAFRIVGDRFRAIDIRYLCRLGIPASRMRTKSDLEKWVLDIGMEYMRIVKNGKMYKANRCLDRMLLLTRKRLF